MAYDNVDKRVVKFEFDNSEFDKKVKQSVKSINKLDESLQFKDVSKSLDKVKVKFSAFEVAAISAISNISNRIVNIGARMIKALSVDNAKEMTIESRLRRAKMLYENLTENGYFKENHKSFLNSRGEVRESSYDVKEGGKEVFGWSNMGVAAFMTHDYYDTLTNPTHMALLMQNVFGSSFLIATGDDGNKNVDELGASLNRVVKAIADTYGEEEINNILAH